MHLDIPCFVISLKRANERREHIRREMGREGLQFEFVDAIDGLLFSPDEARRKTRLGISPAFGLPISPCDVACTMSHGIAMRAVLERGCDRALIFEDDAKLVEGFVPVATNLLAAAPAAWDLLKLSGSGPPPFKPIAQAGRHQIVRPEMPAFMSQAYAITREGCRKLVPFTDPVEDIFDELVQQGWRHKARVLEVVPRLVVATNAPSTILDREGYQGRRSSFGRWMRRITKLRRSLWRRRFHWS